MGLWAACQPVGNIIGAIVVSLIQPYGYEVINQRSISDDICFFSSHSSSIRS